MSSCICPAIFPSCHLVTHVGTIFTIFQIKYNESLFFGSIINPTTTVLKWLSNCLWSYTKSIFLEHHCGKSLKTVFQEQINETLHSLLFPDNPDCPLQDSSFIVHISDLQPEIRLSESLCDLLCCGYFSHVKSFAGVTLLCGGFHIAVPRNMCDIAGQL